jgi:hypothetical protein
MPVNVEPTLNHPVPDWALPQKLEDHDNKVRVKANTALLLEELGSGYEMTPEDNEKAKDLFNKLEEKKTPQERKDELEAMDEPGTALAMASYLSAYDRQLVEDKIQLRTVVTNRLIEISQCGDTRHELKSLELLGKACDLFTERSEITITHKNSEELQEAIREKIRLLMEMNTIDVTPTSERLTNELKDASAE